MDTGAQGTNRIGAVCVTLADYEGVGGMKWQTELLIGRILIVVGLLIVAISVAFLGEWND
jgi:hypothetical protein